MAADELRRALGENIRTSRARHDLSQDDVAEAMGVSQATVSALERGRRDVRLSTVSLIARVLRVSVADLLKINKREGG